MIQPRLTPTPIPVMLRKKRLQVHIDAQSGFCFGVIYAIRMAEETLEETGHLYCLGDIVHNEAEIARLKKQGLQIIDREQLQSLHNESVLIRAHGEPPSTYETAIRNNLTLIDASCPVVLKLQSRLKQSADTEVPVYIFGKRGHAEVEGLVGQTKRDVVVFHKKEELDFSTMPERIALYSQTTKSTEEFYKMYDYIRSKGIEVELNDTTCRQVSNRDQQLREYASQYDKIVFVSGKHSSNGNTLFQVCKRQNPGSYFVSNADEVRDEWFRHGESVGICGATSTPMWLMEAVKAQLESF